MPLPIYTYGNPGDATYSVSLPSFDAVMSTTPDNIINEITAKNIRDVNFTMYEIIQNSITPDFNKITTTGNTTSNNIRVGGLQVNGTSSFINSVKFLSTIADKLGATGGLGYILSATAGGVQWIPNNGTTPTLQQVTTAGKNTNDSINVGGLNISGSASVIGNFSILSTIGDYTGFTGSPGYVLTPSQIYPGHLQWSSIIGNSATPSLHQVTNVGNTTSNRIQVGSLQVNGTSSVLGNFQILSTLADKYGSTGTATYILQSKAGGVEWVPNSGGTTPGLNQVTSAGNTTSNSISIQNSNLVGGFPAQTIILGATTGFIQSFTGIAGGTHPTVGTLYYKGLWFQDGSGFNANINIAPIITTSTFSIPNITGTAAVIQNITLNQALLGGNTSSLSLQVGSATFSGNINTRGIIDSAGSTGSVGYILTQNAAGNLIWQLNYAPISIGAPSASSYTLLITDNQRLLTMTNSSLTTVTIPLSVFTVGSKVDVAQYNTGAVTFAAAAGVVINSTYGYRTIAAQFGVVSAVMTSNNIWLLIGNLIP